jgi:hypothetical protein
MVEIVGFCGLSKVGMVEIVGSMLWFEQGWNGRDSWILSGDVAPSSVILSLACVFVRDGLPSVEM